MKTLNAFADASALLFVNAFYPMLTTLELSVTICMCGAILAL